MRRLRVALICGGRSSEREISLKSGRQVKAALSPQRYEVKVYDPVSDMTRLINDAPQIDVALVMLHGRFGEDGTIQGLLDLLGIPYQCSGVLASALAMDKVMSKRLFRLAGLKVPKDVVLTRDEPYELSVIVNKLGLPLVVKPVDGGSSVGMSLVTDAGQLPAALELAFEHSSRVMVEEYIKGREITGGVLGNKHPLALPLIEIVPKTRSFFDYEAKYTPGATEEVCPAPLPLDLTKQAQQCALRAHQALGCKGYSRTDMILKDNEIYVLETNTIPGMTETSLFPQAARAAGIGFQELIERLIQLALEDNKK